MKLIALRMLLGDTAKFVTLVFGLAFATTLTLQQGGIFMGMVYRAGASIRNVPEADVWVLYPGTRQFDERHPLYDSAIDRVAGIASVEWAVPYLVASGTAHFPDGKFMSVSVVGVDRLTRIGLPDAFDSGHPDMLNDPDAVFFDDLNMDVYRSIEPGQIFEINDRRAVVVGKVTPPLGFATAPTVYTSHERALEYNVRARDRIDYILVKLHEGVDPEEACREIRDTTGLEAWRSEDFADRTTRYMMINTGIAANFAITVLLGLIVGVAIAAQTFYAFVIDNSRNFATLKAMGLGKKDLIKMVLLQATYVALVGWGIGAGITALFGWNLMPRDPISFSLPPWLLVGSLVGMILTGLLAAGIAIFRVVRIQPALVFR